jgi:putative ABC transport system permease protein
MGRLLRIAWRNVWRNKRHTLIALIAISLGLVFLAFMDGAIAGFQQTIFGNAVKLQGVNIQVHAPSYKEKAKRMPLLPLTDPERVVQAALAQSKVVAASERINTGGFLSSREATMPVVITGIEPEKEAPVNLVAKHVTQGRYLAAGDEDLILIGRAMANRLKVGVGDRNMLVGRATHEQMRRRTMTVAGIYDLGLPEVEKSLIYVSLPEAQSLFDLRDQATEVDIALVSIGQEKDVAVALQAVLPGYEVSTWQELNPEMKQSLDVDKQLMNIFGLIVLLIAGVGILNLMLMAVFERTREIGLLAALGMKRREIMSLFLLEGILIGLLSAIAAFFLGGLVVSLVGQYGIDFSASAGMGEMMALLGDRLYPQLAPDPTPSLTPLAAPAVSRSVGTVTASSVVVPHQEAHLGFAISGRVEKVGIAIGDEVRIGDLLVQLEGSEQLIAADTAANAVRLRDAEKGSRPRCC